MRVSRAGAALILVMCLGACGEAGAAGDDAAVASDASAGGDAGRGVSQSAGESSAAPLTVEDVDRWQRGMAAELQAVQEAGTRLRRAQTSEDSLNAVMAANDMSTLAAGADAAGVSQERYQFIRTNLSTAVGYLVPIEKEMDVSLLAAAQVEQLQKDREASLAQLSSEVPTAVVQVLRPRASELRNQDLTLTGERLKASGVGG